MANGSWQAIGLQTGLPNQGQNSLGPFTFTFSATENDTVQTLASGNNTITVPSTAAGVWIVPPVGGTVALEFAGVRINPASPTFVNFDPAAVPASVVVNAAGTVAVGFRFT